MVAKSSCLPWETREPGRICLQPFHYSEAGQSKGGTGPHTEGRAQGDDADLGLHFHPTKDPSEPCPTETGDTKPQPLLQMLSLHPMEGTDQDLFGNEASREAGLGGRGGNLLLRAELWCHPSLSKEKLIYLVKSQISVCLGAFNRKDCHTAL